MLVLECCRQLSLIPALLYRDSDDVFRTFPGGGTSTITNPPPDCPALLLLPVRISAGDFIGSALSAMRHTQLSTHHGRGDESPPSTVPYDTRIRSYLSCSNTGITTMHHTTFHQIRGITAFLSPPPPPKKKYPIHTGGLSLQILKGQSDLLE